MVAQLSAANIKPVPTGIDHGTITAVCDGLVAEVTSLRQDVSTDGRRATVAFTQDWALDAMRRDFTINALYLSNDRTLYDYVGGRRDLSARRVRFIGNADDRIKEDYLRILRFFRFSARFASSLDIAGLDACAQNMGGVKHLARERVGQEALAIFSVPPIMKFLPQMEKSGCLHQIWEAAPDLSAGAKVLELSARINTALPLLVLAALFSAQSDGLGKALRLSNAQKTALYNSLRNVAAVLGGRASYSRQIYRLGKDAFIDAVRVAYGIGKLDEAARALAEQTAHDFAVPAFVIGGADLLRAGLQPGPEMAQLLTKIEDAWIDAGFPDASVQHEIAAKLIAAHRLDPA